MVIIADILNGLKMKTTSIYGLLLLTLVWGSCSKVIIYEPTEAEKGAYSRVYMPAAERGLTTVSLSNQVEEKVFTFNAYLGGPIDAQADIAVTFAVDNSKIAAYNEANGSNYKALPAEAYELAVSQAVIKAGERSTPTLQVKVTSGDHLELFESYLLPITIADASASLNEAYTTAYFLFPVSYPPGEVPTELIGSLGADWGRYLTNYSRGSLLRHDHNFDIWVHKPDAEGKFTAAPERIGENWGDSESFYFINDQSMLVRNHPYWAGLFRFSITENYFLEGYGAWETFWLGDFWDQYVMVPYGDYMLTVEGDGVLRRQAMYSHPNAGKTELASGFNGFRQILSYQNDALLALDGTGRLWYYPMSDQAVPGTRRLVGTGWQMYSRILVTEAGDILALDPNGDLYRYAFNPVGFYPLQ